jgi:hypothetical protein
MTEQQLITLMAIDVMSLVEHELEHFIDSELIETEEQINSAKWLAMAIKCSIYSNYLEEEVNCEVAA